MRGECVLCGVPVGDRCFVAVSADGSAMLICERCTEKLMPEPVEA